MENDDGLSASTGSDSTRPTMAVLELSRGLEQNAARSRAEIP